MGCSPHHAGGHIQPPGSVLHTEAKGRWGQTVFGLQNSQEGAKGCNRHLLWMGRKHPETQSTQTHRSQGPVCFWPTQTGGAGPSRTALDNTIAGKAVGKASLLASPAAVTMLRNTTQHHSPTSGLLRSLCIPFPILKRTYKVSTLVASLWDAPELLPFSSAARYT